MIKVENVCFQYKNSEVKVLDHLNFSVNDGELVAIVGSNGSGKSTIGKLLANIIKLKQGNIFIDDLDISNHKNRQILQNMVGIVFQNPENQIIFDHIDDEFAFFLKDLSKDERENRINTALAQVDMLSAKDKELYTLSLGQKQRIMIAEILAKKPKYIILDEPTTMIDSQGKETIYHIIAQLKKQGFTIICITNLADEILLADRTLILNEGKIVQEISKADLLAKSNILTQFGINLPTLLKILVELKEQGIELPLDELSIPSIVNALKGKIINEKCT